MRRSPWYPPVNPLVIEITNSYLLFNNILCDSQILKREQSSIIYGFLVNSLYHILLAPGVVVAVFDDYM